MKSVMIVDYGLGNLGSVARAVRFLGAEPVISGDPDLLLGAERVILPGVGAFGVAMENLKRLDLVSPLKQYAASGRPLLGICLGMQLFMEESTEGGLHAGLGLIPGRVVRLHEERERGIKVPHVGWSGLQPERREWSDTVLDGLHPGDALYFVHSYYAQPRNDGDVLACTTYGDARFCSVIARGALVGCQAHPEKSSGPGLKILGNFLDVHQH
ncbi:MAG: imidazole glycerol phosphate synthase subunit HisH [Rhodocyclaceae bacterium]|jgi:glutamine amidotransferase|nr:imidazole glycerol phosphate synthase subunit HisH [Rhodocyclaceae bacterium]